MRGVSLKLRSHMKLIRYFLVLVLVGAFLIASLGYRFIADSHLAIQGDVTTPEQLVSKVFIKSPNTAHSDLTTPNSDVKGQQNTFPENESALSPPSPECVWYTKPSSPKGPYFLTAVLLVRIYYTDLAGLSSREMLQWLHYLKYIGVEHLYVYDAYVLRNESQSRALAPYVQEGFVTYVDWSHRAYPYSIDGTQLSAYQDCITRFGADSAWQTAIDIDEYPFCLNDQKPGFTARYVKAFSELHPEASEITMQNYLFLGKPLSDSEQTFLIGKLWRRTQRRGNTLVKPIYKPSHVMSAQVHHNALNNGQSLDAPDDQFRMNHYWGARLQNWGEDKPEIIAITEEDKSIEPVLQRIIQCVENKEDLHKKHWN